MTCKYYGCSHLTSVTIPNSVTSIGYEAFVGCSGLTSIEIPNSVTSIGINAFVGCSGLTSISVENGNPNYDSRDNCNAIIETSTNNILQGCKNTAIPNSVTSIGDRAFSFCFDLTSIIIPNSVISIGNYAFYNCNGLTSVTCEATSVPSTESSVFYNVPQSSATLYVPEASVETYKTISPWRGFGSIVAIGDEPALHGDVNEDGVVNGTDIQAVINFIVESQYDEKADVNKDDIVNGTDIQEVINIIVNAE